MCSRNLDQVAPTWLAAIPNVTYFYDNERIFHRVSAQFFFFKVINVCEMFVSVHGSYPNEMYAYWNTSLAYSRGIPPNYTVPLIEPFDKKCRHDPRGLNWKAFSKEWYFEPRPCNDSDFWNIVEESTKGRSKSWD